MNPSNECYELIKAFEGRSLRAYPDPATGGAPWTIGDGHTGPEVHPGMTITDEQADELLINDVAGTAEGVNNLLRVDVTQQMFDALVCFAYNVGLGNLANSTLLKMVNQEQFKDAAGQFIRWDKAAGREMLGLKRRRMAEASLFVSGGTNASV